jgi:hypothetical protein
MDAVWPYDMDDRCHRKIRSQKVTNPAGDSGVEQAFFI